ncbi:hypothetical protein [Streptacidiphilus anmyonensis]|uniref:hypothetical protein n=1 Tax=Streptacidiphilus anmyonensis TaxID=405782 RepID=UPI0005A9D864|nr:hypothetical protein [Streptacidiphilus anmyonensis]
MRRLSALLATTGVLAPLVVAASTLPAAASGPSVTVHMTGRTGAHASGQVRAENISTFMIYSGTADHAISLPKGQYAVIGDVQENATTTIGASVVTIAGASTVSLDARHGKAVNVGLDLPNAGSYTRYVDATVCGGQQSMGIEASGAPGSVFVIPNASSLLHFAYLGGWQSPSSNYVVTGRTGSGVPSTPGGSFHRSGLARLDITARTGTDDETDGQLTLQPQAPNNACGSGMWGTLGEFSLPTATTAYVSPGTWGPRLDASDGLGEMAADRSLLAGRHYYQSFGNAVWSPRSAMPVTWEHKISIQAGSLLQDPTPGVTSFWASKGTARLSQGGKVLHQATVTDYGSYSTFDTAVRSAGWYDLSVTANRYHPGLATPNLSTAASLTFHFWANPAVQQLAPVYLTRFLPTGLNGANQAAPGSTTTVNLALDRPDTDPADIAAPSDPATSVKVWASTNGGISWQAVTVKHVNGNWTAYVPNPASGAVSLRSQVNDAHGDYAIESIYRAYAIG